MQVVCRAALFRVRPRPIIEMRLNYDSHYYSQYAPHTAATTFNTSQSVNALIGPDFRRDFDVKGIIWLCVGKLLLLCEN